MTDHIISVATIKAAGGVAAIEGFAAEYGGKVGPPKYRARKAADVALGFAIGFEDRVITLDNVDGRVVPVRSDDERRAAIDRYVAIAAACEILSL